FPGSGTPRNFAADPCYNLGGEPVDDFTDFQLHAGLLQGAGAVWQGVADQGQALFVAPCSAVGSHQLVFGSEPIGLGIDQRSIHIPQDRLWDGTLASGVKVKTGAWHESILDGRVGLSRFG